VTAKCEVDRVLEFRVQPRRLGNVLLRFLADEIPILIERETEILCARPGWDKSSCAASDHAPDQPRFGASDAVAVLVRANQRIWKVAEGSLIV